MPSLSGSISLGTNSIGGNISANNVNLGGSVVSGTELGLATWGKITGDINEQADLISLTDKIHIDTTAHWNAQPSLVGELGHIYVYTDYVLEDGEYIPGIKIGDGSAYLIDAPFVTGDNSLLLSHINNDSIHVTAEEKLFWDDKVTCFLSQGDNETVIFTKEDLNG